jgi:branched-chain amino acid transport system permease protein
MQLGREHSAEKSGYINPERGMGLSLSIEIVLVGVVGGWQSVLGPTVGSLLLSPTSEIIRGEFGGSYAGLHLVLYGLLLMIVILFLPKGINEPLTRALHKLEAKLWPARSPGSVTSSRGPAGTLDVPKSTSVRGE